MTYDVSGAVPHLQMSGPWSVQILEPRPLVLIRSLSVCLCEGAVSYRGNDGAWLRTHWWNLALLDGLRWRQKVSSAQGFPKYATWENALQYPVIFCSRSDNMADESGSQSTGTDYQEQDLW